MMIVFLRALRVNKTAQAAAIPGLIENILLDRRILYKLDCNSRQSLSELARSVRLGRDLVTYRIDRLRSEGST